MVVIRWCVSWVCNGFRLQATSRSESITAGLQTVGSLSLTWGGPFYLGSSTEVPEDSGLFRRDCLVRP